MRKLLLSVFIVISLWYLPVSGEEPTDVLHMFEGGPDDGSKPYGSLTLISDGRLFGMTSAGGTYGYGVIFRINPDGSDYVVLYHFGSTPNDGSSPHGSLTETDVRLYGMTSAGGTYAGGTIFGINPNGSDYDLLYHFGGGPDDGVLPVGSLAYVDSVFYGMTSAGGTYAGGTIFSIKPDGSDYNVLYHFGSGPDDGVTPAGSLTFIDSLLCGMTSEGGAYAGGTIFSIKLDGSDYSSIGLGHTPDEPVVPVGSLEIGPSGRNFAFMGDGCFVTKPGFGVFLSVGSASGEDFQWPDWLPIHMYLGAPDDGACPYGSPTYADGVLYGMTSQGGSSDFGTIFSIKPDGSGYNLFHHFGGAPYDGSSPFGSLTYVDGILYGMTSIGGSSDVGVIFSIEAIATGIEDIAAPRTFDLYQNIPNPFNPATTIRFDLPRAVHVKLSIYNVKGELVSTVIDQHMTEGRKEVSWTARDDRGSVVSSGIYFYQIKAGDFVQTRKMVLLR